MKRSRSDLRAKLEYYDRLLSKTILKYQVRRCTEVPLVQTVCSCLQNPVTGLLPAFLFEDGTAGWAENHAWVRDNVYSVLAVWGLATVYRRGAEGEENREKAYNLEQVRRQGECERLAVSVCCRRW